MKNKPEGMYLTEEAAHAQLIVLFDSFFIAVVSMAAMTMPVNPNLPILRKSRCARFDLRLDLGRTLPTAPPETSSRIRQRPRKPDAAHVVVIDATRMGKRTDGNDMSSEKHSRRSTRRQSLAGDGPDESRRRPAPCVPRYAQGR